MNYLRRRKRPPFLWNTEYISMNPLPEKHIKSILINPNIFKYWEFGELKVLVLNTKSDITSKCGTIFLLLYAITNEKTVKLTQIDRIPAASRVSQQKHVPITLVGMP